MIQDQVLSKMDIASLHELDVVHKLLYFLFLTGLDVGILLAASGFVVDLKG